MRLLTFLKNQASLSVTHIHTFTVDELGNLLVNVLNTNRSVSESEFLKFLQNFIH